MLRTKNGQRKPSRKIVEWCPPGRRRKGRSRISLMQEVTSGMRENNNLQHGIDRQERMEGKK